MLLSILHDILRQDEAFFYHKFQPEYRAQSRRGLCFKWEYASLKKIVKSLQDYQATKRFYLLIDAMDESEDSDMRDILSLLFELCLKMEHCVAKVFVASRPLAQLDALETHRYQFHNFIRLQDETTSDIFRFAHSSLDGLNLTHLLSQATDYIVRNAQGVFVWVKLVQQELMNAHDAGYSETAAFELLKQLPTELEAMYERMFDKMKENKSCRLYGPKMLRLILFAKRPLTVDELLHAFGIPDDRDLDPKYALSDDSFQKRIPTSERFINACGGDFIEIKRRHATEISFGPVLQPVGNGTVQVMHQTLREFFLKADGCVAKSDFRTRGKDAHICISLICIRYLMLCALKTSPANSLPDIKSWTSVQFKDYAQYLDKRPLAIYALCHLKHHINGCEQDGDIAHVTLRFINNLTNEPAACLLEDWVSSYLKKVLPINKQGAIAKSFKDKTLHAAVQNGYTTATELLLTVGADFESVDGDGRTPLWWAIRNGHGTIVNVLVEKGARVKSTEGIYDRTSLSWAAERGHKSIVKVLLDKGANVDSKASIYGRTPLIWAAEKGHEAIVKVLLDKRAYVDSMDIYGRTPLSWAAENGHETIVKRLLSKGADVHSKESVHDRTPLSWAAENGHQGIVQMLLEGGAGIDWMSKYGRTPLSWAAESGHKSIVKMLLDTGADIDSKSNHGRTPLSWAAAYGHEATVQLLLGNGADMNSRSNSGRTPLSWAAENGHEAIVKILRDSGARVDTHSN